MELLYLDEGHHVYIKDFNPLMFTFAKHKGSKHFCMYCLKNFRTKDVLAKHQKDCIIFNGVQAIELPEPYTDKNGKERIPSAYFKNH